MHCKSENFSLTTSKHEEFIEITRELNEILQKNNSKSGIIKIYIPHTTAAVTINQSANPDVPIDLLTILSELTMNSRLLNVEGNSDAHFKSSLFGTFLEIPFQNVRLSLGEWQGVFFCEFDGPRTRNVKVQIWETDYC